MHDSERPAGAVADEIVAMLVAYHQAGWFVRDPSPVVLGRDEDGRLEIDEADLERRSHTDVPQLALPQLFCLMRGETPRRLIAAGADYLQRREMRADLETVLANHREAALERCFHENRDFKLIDTGDLVWHVRRALLCDEHLEILHEPDFFLEGEGEHVLKAGRGTTLATTPGEAVLKRFNLKKVRNLVKNRFAPTRARLAFQRAYHLETTGIRTARAIAFAERTRLGCPTRSYLLMERVPGVRPGAQAFQEWNGERPALKQAALCEAGRLLGLLHDAGFANRDLKSTNLLAGDDGQVWLIDLDGVQHRGRVNDETRVKNLRRIVRDLPQYGELSLRETMRFLKAYTRSYRKGDPRDLYRRLAEEPL